MAVALQVQEFLDSPPMCEVCGHFSRPAGALSEEPWGHDAMVVRPLA